MESVNQIDVITDDTVSIADLVAKQLAGFSVVRSAHVGNLSPYNLTIAEAGIPVLSVDHTVTGIDTNYFPENVMNQSGTKMVAPLGRIVSRATTFDGGQLDQLHLDSARLAVPGSQVFTNTEYLRANEAVANEIVSIALDVSPHLFVRVATPDGRTDNKRLRVDTLVDSVGIMQLNDNPKAEETAVIMPNELDILINFVAEFLNSGEAVQYHLSGPDMVKYISSRMGEINKMYEAVASRASFGSLLPSSLTVRLVPSSAARFATTVERGQKLEGLINMYLAVEEELDVLAQRRSTFFNSVLSKDIEFKRAFVAQTKSTEASFERLVAEKVAELPELFLTPGGNNKQGGFITQYDVIAEGGLYVPEVNRTFSMARLGAMSLALEKIQRRYVT